LRKGVFSFRPCYNAGMRGTLFYIRVFFLFAILLAILAVWRHYVRQHKIFEIQWELEHYVGTSDWLDRDYSDGRLPSSVYVGYREALYVLGLRKQLNDLTGKQNPKVSQKSEEEAWTPDLPWPPPDEPAQQK
jgi:hypothetical protein